MNYDDKGETEMSSIFVHFAYILKSTYMSAYESNCIHVVYIRSRGKNLPSQPHDFEIEFHFVITWANIFYRLYIFKEKWDSLKDELVSGVISLYISNEVCQHRTDQLDIF